MPPQDNNSETYKGSAYDASLELEEGAGPSLQVAPSPVEPKHHALRQLLSFKHHKALLIINGVVLVLISIIGVVGFLLSSGGSPDSNGTTGSKKIANYATSSLPVQNAKTSEVLQVGSADQLAINGQVTVGNTLVLTPTATPTNPTTGQIYYNQVNNTPYYYNGTQFVSLAQSSQATIQQYVSAIGGSSGSLSLGNGLQVSGGQLGLQLQAGNGVAINGSTVSNTGVISVAAGSPNVTVSQDGNGNYTISDNSFTGSGTAGQVALFSGSQTLGDSILNQSGTSLTAAGTLVVQGAASADSLNATNGITGGTLSVASGDLTVDGSGNLVTTGSVSTNSLQQTTTGNLSIGGMAGGDDLVFNSGGRTFILPSTGTGSQTICTTGITCATGGGQAVLLQPGSAMTDPGTGSSIWINNTAGGNLLELEGSGSDKFVVSNGGNVTAAGTLAVKAAGGLTIGVAGSVTGSLNLANGSNTNQVVLQGAAPSGSGNATIILPTLAGGTSDSICLETLKNCTAIGAAGGDLTGNYPNPTIADLQGKTLTISATPTTGAVLQYNGSAFVDGLISNANLAAGTYSNITGTGALASGSIATGFGAISTANNITTTATIQGNILNATGAGSTIELNGTSINTAGTLTHVAYLNAASQTFTGDSIFSATGATVLALTGAPPASASLLQLSSALATGAGSNVNTNGTYLGINAPNANDDFFNLQANGISEFQVSGAGNLTTAGAVTFSGLGCNVMYTSCVAHLDSNGVVTASPVALGVDTTGLYVAGLKDGAGTSKGGTLTIANSLWSGTTLNINNAKADGTTKGIATFNATNFSDNGSGVINTIQNIATTSTPTFAGLTLQPAANGTVFQINNAATASILSVNTTTGQIVATNSNFCLNNCTGGAKLTVGSTATIGELIDETGSNNILDLQNNGTNVTTIGSTGAALFQNSTDSTTAFQIQNQAGTSNLLVADTTDSKLAIDGAVNNSNTSTLQVTGSASVSAGLQLASPSSSSGYISKATTAGTGGVSAHDVVVINSSDQVVDTTTARDSRVYGVSTGAAAANAAGTVIIFGNFTVNATAVSTPINVGDQLVTSTTSGAVMSDNSATTGIIGIALTALASGTGTVNVAVRPVGGETNPTFRGSGDSSTVAGSGVLFQNTTDSTNAFEIQNAAGTANLLIADTTNGRIGIGGAPNLSSTAILQVTGSADFSSTILGNSNYQINTTATNVGNIGKTAIAGTGGVTNHDVVVMNSSDQIVDTTTARDPRVYGVVNATATSGNAVNVAMLGNSSVNAVGPINVGDQLVTSTTSGAVMTDNSATTGIVGYALTSLASGTGTVNIELGIVNGQSTPIFSPQSDSTTAFQIQNANRSTTLFQANTTNTSIGIAGASTTAGYALNVTGSINASTNLYVNGVAVCTVTTCAAGSSSSSFVNNSTTLQTNANFNIQSASTSAPIAVFQAASGQTSDLLQVYGTGGTVVARVTNAGNFASNTLYVGENGGEGQFASSGTGGGILASNGSASAVVLASKGAASQTADLFDLQNSSGTVLAGFTSAGALQGGNGSGSNNAVVPQNLVLAGGQGTGTGAGGNINFQIAKASITSGSTLNSESTVASISGTNGAATFENSANSATAFQVQNAAGTAALSINTNTLTTTLQAGTGNDTTTLGANLITTTDFCNAAWTTTNWTLSPTCSSPPATSATHNTGNTSALSTNQVTPVMGNTYEISYSGSGSPAAGVTVSFGGVSFTDSINSNNSSWTESKIITATSNTGNLTFTPTLSTFNGTISSVSIQQVTQLPTATLVVNNASGGANIQVTASSIVSNTFIGLSSGVSNSTGIQNTTLGYQALQNNTTGGSNAALGYQALQNNTTGGANTAVGAQALQANTFGRFNTAVGNQALEAVTSGNNNAALGYGALTAVTTGYQDTGLGTQTLFGLTTGSNDTAVGYNAGRTLNSTVTLTTGTTDTFLGSTSGPGQNAYQVSNATAVGAGALVNQSNALILGCTAGLNSCGGAVNVGIGSQYAPNALTVSPSTYGTNGTAGTTTTITQSTTTVTGSTSPATAFTSAMVGGTLYYNDGSTATISSVNVGAQTMVVSVSKTISSAATYTIVYGGFNVTSTGTAYLQPTTDSTTAFQIQNAADTTNLFVADTTDSKIGIGGAPTSSGSTLQVTGSLSTSTGITDGGNLIINSGATGNGQITKPLVAGSGGVSTGDVAVINSSGQVIDTTTARDPRVYGVVSAGAGSGSSAYIVLAGNATVNAVGPINIGDQLVTSTTSGRVVTDNNATTGIIGIALTALASGNGTVSVAVNTVHGQSTPDFTPTTDSTTAFQIQNAARSSVLFDADTTDSVIGIGAAPTAGGAALQVTGAISTTTNLSVGTGTGLTTLSQTALVIGGVTVCTSTGCGASSGSGNYIQNGTVSQVGGANFNIQSTATTSVVGVLEGATGQTADLLDLQSDPSGTGINVLTVGNTGNTLIKPSTNSTTAFQIQNAAGTTTLLAADTTTNKLSVTGQLALTGGLSLTGLTIPAAPTVTNIGTPGSGHYTYAVSAVNANGGSTVISSTTQTLTGNATLSGSNYNQITWTAVTGAASYNIYRTAVTGGSPSTTGLIGNVLASSTLSFNDTAASVIGSAVTVDNSDAITGNATFKSSSNSATAFQVQNTSGTSLLQVNTSTNSVLFGGGSNATLSAEKFTGSFTAGSGWTTNGLSGTSATITHSSGVTPISPSTAITVAANSYYQVSFIITGSPTAGQTVTPSIGGTSGTAIAGNDGAEVQVIQASGTGNLAFTPTTSWNGTISSISVKLITVATSAVAIQGNTFNGGGDLSDFYGYQAGLSDISTAFDTGVGTFALQSATTGSSDTALGTYALGLTTTGSDNVGIGYAAGFSNLGAVTTGSYNTFVGYNSGPGNSTQLQVSGAIGAYSVVSQSNSLVLGCLSGVNGCTTSTSVGVDNATPNFALDVTGTINASTQIDVAGSQIASSNLSDSSNLAKLNGTGPQIFTGNNKFTGSGDNSTVAGSGTLIQNATDSTNAFEIQNQAGTSNLFIADTTDSKIGIGGAPSSAGQTLQVTGGITTTTNLGLATASASSGSIYKFATAGTGGVTANDVVVLNSSNQAVDTTTARDARIYGVASGTATSGNGVSIYLLGNATVNATGPISIGDQLVTSTTSGRVVTDNNATTGILGTALSALASGNGTVSVAIRPSDGQYTPNFRPATDSTSTFNIQNAGGTAFFTADSSDLRITVTNLVVTATLTVDGHIITGNSSGSTTIAAQSAGVGSTGTCSLTPASFAAGNDTAGTLTFTPGGSGINNGNQCIVTFSSTYGSYPHVILTPANAASQALGVYGGATAATTFNVGTATAGSSGVTYTYNYIVVQ